jgi:MFS family permease
MVVLDATIVNVALPSAQKALHFSADNRQWVITAYALSFGSLLLLGGKLGDLFGRKWTLIAGLSGFALASAMGGLAQSFAMLVAARALQGVFGALLAPSALGLLTVTFQGSPDRAKAFGIFSAIAAGGASVGLLLGGILTQALSWRWSLYVNLAIAVPAAVVALRLLNSERPAHRPKIDLPGVAVGSLGLFGLVYGFSNAETHSWSNPVTVVAWPPAPCSWLPSAPSSAASSTRCCPSASSGTGHAEAPSRRSRWPARPCSRCSCFSPTTCSRTSATPR